MAAFWDPATGKNQLNAVKSAPDALGVTVQTLEVRNAADAEAAFAAANQHGAGAVLSSPFIGANTKLLADLATARRLPGITLFTDFAQAGERLRQLADRAEERAARDKPGPSPIPKAKVGQLSDIYRDPPRSFFGPDSARTA